MSNNNLKTDRMYNEDIRISQTMVDAGLNLLPVINGPSNTKQDGLRACYDSNLKWEKRNDNLRERKMEAREASDAYLAFDSHLRDCGVNVSRLVQNRHLVLGSVVPSENPNESIGLMDDERPMGRYFVKDMPLCDTEAAPIFSIDSKYKINLANLYSLCRGKQHQDIWASGSIPNSLSDMWDRWDNQYKGVSASEYPNTLSVSGVILNEDDDKENHFFEIYFGKPALSLHGLNGDFRDWAGEYLPRKLGGRDKSLGVILS